MLLRGLLSILLSNPTKRGPSYSTQYYYSAHFLLTWLLLSWRSTSFLSFSRCDWLIEISSLALASFVLSRMIVSSKFWTKNNVTPQCLTTSIILQLCASPYCSISSWLCWPVNSEWVYETFPLPLRLPLAPSSLQFDVKEMSQSVEGGFRLHATRQLPHHRRRVSLCWRAVPSQVWIVSATLKMRVLEKHSTSLTCRDSVCSSSRSFGRSKVSLFCAHFRNDSTFKVHSNQRKRSRFQGVHFVSYFFSHCVGGLCWSSYFSESKV